jgi:putative spermidine/putrescine transport system permease protein
MTSAVTAPDIVRAADGVPLKAKLRRAERIRRLWAFALVAPLLMFIIVTFVVPIATMLYRSVNNPELATNLPRTAAALANWDGQGLPNEAVFAAFAADLAAAHTNKTAALIGKRLNYEIPGARSKFIATARKIADVKQGPYKDALLTIDPLWTGRETWVVLARAVRPITGFYLLSAIDMRLDADNQLTRVAASEGGIFLGVFWRTLVISVTVTLATLVLAFPLAYLLASLPTRMSNLLMILVLLPFWTALLVRTTAWVVLLQTEGVVNDALIWLGVVDQPLQLIFSRFGTIVAMTHIQLPFTLLPIYSVMKTISPSHVRAARSLGAGPFYAFWRVYFPQTVPGIAAGCLLTFILSLGYYITPALVGGPTDQMISYFAAYYISEELNWGMASALGVALLTATMILFVLYSRLVGIDKVKLG